jgi:hypothetical protein
VAVDYARTLASHRGVKGVRFERGDTLRDQLPGGMDVVVSDLRRTAMGAAVTWVGCRLLSRSDVFREDGMRSVAAAFTTNEARILADRAGLAGARIEQVWPQRWLLTWRKAP